VSRERSLLPGLALVIASLLSPVAAQAWGGASSADAGNGDPGGSPGIYDTSPSPAANPDSPGAGPHSGPSDNLIDPATGHYLPRDAPPPGLTFTFGDRPEDQPAKSPPVSHAGNDFPNSARE
jgi:hypothetical protein